MLERTPIHSIRRNVPAIIIKVQHKEPNILYWEVISLVLKVVYHLQNVRNENSCSIPSTPSLILVSGFRGRFPVNGTDLNPESKTVLDYFT